MFNIPVNISITYFEEVLTEVRNELKRSIKTTKNDLKPSKTTKNRLIKGIRLRFSKASRDSVQKKGCLIKNKKLDL